MNYNGATYDAVVAKNYDKDRKLEDHWVKENEFIESYFKPNKVGVILDTPVGTGRFLKYYSQESNIIGVDISSYMLREAAKVIESANIKNVTLRLGDASNLDFISNRSIDFIVCFRLFHLVQYQERLLFLKEFSRVVKGEIVLQAYIKQPKKNVIERFLRYGLNRLLRIIRKSGNGNNKPWSNIKSYDMSADELELLARDAGLVITKKVELCKYYGTDVCVFVLNKGE